MWPLLSNLPWHNLPTCPRCGYGTLASFLRGPTHGFDQYTCGHFIDTPESMVIVRRITPPRST